MCKRLTMVKKYVNKKICKRLTRVYDKIKIIAIPFLNFSNKFFNFDNLLENGKRRDYSPSSDNH